MEREMKKFILSLLILTFLIPGNVRAAWDDTLPAGTTNASDIDTVVQANNTALESLLSAPYGWVNLKVIRSTAAIVTVTADQLYLQSTSNLGVRETSVSESIDITTSGASGLDTGSEGSSRWYYIYIIRKSSDGTINGLLSESATSPTLPSGYDQKALISAVRNDSSSDFIDFVQVGRSYWYKKVDYAMVTGTTADLVTWVAIDTSAYVPSTLSTHAYGQLTGVTTTYVTNDNSVTGGTDTHSPKIGSNTGASNWMTWELEIVTANTLYYVSTWSASSAVYIHGFYINKL